VPDFDTGWQLFCQDGFEKPERRGVRSMHPMPHLAFNGNCAEAVRFCASGLDRNLEVLMSGADSPTASCTCDWP
jgi:hypothetical protein